MTTPQDDSSAGGQPPSFPGAMPPPQGGFAPEPVGTRPKEVDLSFWLWVSSFVIGLVGLLLFVGEFDAIRDMAVQEARRQAQLDGAPLDEAQLENIIGIGLIVAVIIGLLISAVQLLLAVFMRKGRNWARIILAVLGGLSVLSGLYSLTTESGARLGLTAISVLVVLGAVVTMFLPAANPWFRRRGEA